MNPAGGKAKYLMPALVLGAAPVLLADWFIVASVLGRDCVVSEGGNITDCGGGLSEEELSVASGLIALVMLILQLGLIILVRRRIRSRPQ